MENSVIHLTVGVTGHRDLPDQNLADIEQSVRAFFNQLKREFPGLPVQLLTALAEGADQLAARVALSMNIPVIAILPMEQSEYEQDFTSGQKQAAFRSLLQQSTEVISLPRARACHAGGTDVLDRERQYAQLGLFLSNHCHVLLALWDGKLGTALGGTGDVVNYHVTAMMEGFEEEPSAATLLAENENDLVYHVVCARDRPDGLPRKGLKSGEVMWFSSRDRGKPSDQLPLAYRHLLESLHQFVIDHDEHRQAVEKDSSNLLSDLPELELPNSARITDRLFQMADGLAIHYQGRVNLSLKVTYGMAVVMGLVLLMYSESDGPRYLVLLFLLLFFSGVVVNGIGKRRQWHRKYLDYRALAEGLRVQLYWNLAGVVDAGTANFAYDNFLQKQDVELGWIRHVMRIASLHRDRGNPPQSGWLQWVIGQWVGDAQEHSGQLAYYRRKQEANSVSFRKTQWLGTLSLWAGIAIAGVLFGLGSQEHEGYRKVLLILMGILPLIAGVWDAYSHKKAEKELIRQYRFMGSVFERARQRLDESEDIAFQRLVLKALGKAALDEGAEWLLIHRERPPEHGGL